MSKPLTLYVVRTTRPPAVVTDIVANARWASLYPCLVVAVVEKGRASDYEICGADLVHDTDIPDAALGDFQLLDGIRAASHKNMSFEQAICFREDAIFLNRGLDKWAAEMFYREPVDFIAAADRNYYAESFLRLADLFSKWGLPHENFDRAPQPITANSAVFCATAKFVKELFYRRLLVPPDYNEWPLSVGAYLTWACHMLMMSSRMTGSMDKQIPPFYVNDGWGGLFNAPPHLLHSHMLVYWSIRRVVGFNETDIRDWMNKRKNAL